MGNNTTKAEKKKMKEEEDLDAILKRASSYIVPLDILSGVMVVSS